MNWKDINGYEGKYMISEFGDVKSLVNHNSASLTTIKKTENVKGYKRVKLWSNGKSKNHFVHRLVATAFIHNPNSKPQVNHKNGDKLDNRVDNLEWCTAKENIDHSIKNGYQNPVGETNFNSKLTRNDVLQIRSIYEQGFFNVPEISKSYNVSLNNVRGIVKGEYWTHL